MGGCDVSLVVTLVALGVRRGNITVACETEDYDGEEELDGADGEAEDLEEAHCCEGKVRVRGR